MVHSRRNGWRPRGRDGFTLIELVVVMGLILVLTSMIAPTFRMSPIRRVENMAHLMVAELERARSESLGNRREIRVDFDVVGGTYTAYMDHDDDNSITGVTAEIAAFPEFGQKELADQVIFGRGSATEIPGDAGTDEVTLPSDQLLFDEQALPSPWGTMGTIYLRHSTDASAVSAVSVASSGAFTAWRWWPDPGEWR